MFILGMWIGSVMDRQVPLQAPCLFGGPHLSALPVPCKLASTLEAWKPAWPHGLGKK